MSTDSWYDDAGMMTAEHPLAFFNLPVREQPKWAPYKCRSCQGHGLRNLALFEYRGVEEDPSSRHFKMQCSQCNGWGWTAERQDHEHKWASKNIGRGLRRETCLICGKENVIDSTD